MIILESSLSSRYFKHGLETGLLEKVAEGIPIVLAIYLVLKLGELLLSGEMGLLFTQGLMSVLFWAELLLGSVFTSCLVHEAPNRQSANALLGGAIILLLGMILNRFNVSWFAVQHPDPITYVPTFMSNVSYMPTLPEISVSLGIFAAGILAFGLAARYLPVFEHRETDPGSAATD